LTIIINAKRHRDEVQRMERLLEIEHAHIPHLEFTLGCTFYGPQEGEYVTEYVMEINNKGRVQHTLTALKLRVRGIKKAEKLAFWDKHPERLKFPDEILETQVIHKNYGFFFIEPNVHQTITFTSKVSDEYKFIVVWAEFSYGTSRAKVRGKKHSAERVFEVRANSI
jgi:hypothetical protein